eukprot:scaffold1484_cov153-Skeletonema_menzelii.AAC.1
MNDNNYEARASDVDLERITSSTHNALILEKLRSNDDEFTTLGIVGVDHNWPDEEDFIVEEGDNLGWLGYFIGKSKQLGSLWVFHLPGDDSFRQGLAQNQSIQELHICRDLGEAGFQSLAPFFHNNNTLEELNLSLSINSLECANIASLLGLRQIKSLKRIVFENDLIGDGFVAIAHALRAQPQLEELILCLDGTDMEDAPFGQRGCAALGATMKNWRSSSLKKLVIHASDFDDDGLLSLVEGMANCVNLEHLDLDGNDQITEIGLSALSDLFRSKKFYLQELDLSYMAIHDDGMICLAAGAASIMTLKSLDLSRNAFGDEGLQAMAVGLSNSKNLESLNLSVNGPFSAIGLRSLSDMIPAALKVLCLASNGINDEGLQALAVGLRKHITIETLNLSGNAIGSAGVRALTAAEITSLRSLGLASNAINDEALKVLVEGIETLSIETLNLSMNNMITSSGLAVLTPIFRRKCCSLKKIDLDPTNIGDSVSKDFAEGLVGNESLTNLLFGYTNVTALG